MLHHKNKTTARFIESFMRLNKLYEGLIKSYPVSSTIRYFAENISKLKGNETGFTDYKLKITYNVEENFNESLPSINIIFKKVPYGFSRAYDDKFLLMSEKDAIDVISKWFDVCGWYLTNIELINGVRWEDGMKLKDIGKLIFRARFDTEVERKFWPSHLYHLTPKNKLKKIMWNGLSPRRGNKRTNHEEHIYLFGMQTYDSFKVKCLIEELGEYTKSDDYVLLEIDTSGIKKLFTDPDLDLGYFTFEPISPSYLREIEIK